MQRMKNTEHEIVEMVYAAKTDTAAADLLIQKYLGFIRAEMVKAVRRPQNGYEDEESIAMFAFYEAILNYEKGRGAFLSYAARAIRSRLIDYYRKERRHRNLISLDEPFAGEEEDASRKDTLADGRDEYLDYVHREAGQKEIREFEEKLREFGLCFSDVADNSPRQERTLAACASAIRFAAGNQQLLDEVLKTGKLPLGKLVQGSGAERKTLERHRKYILAMLLIQTNGYEIIRGHLRHVLKGGRPA